MASLPILGRLSGTAGRPTEVAPCWGLRRSDPPVHSAHLNVRATGSADGRRRDAGTRRRLLFGPRKGLRARVLGFRPRPGRVAQRESARLTRERSQVQNLPRPPLEPLVSASRPRSRPPRRARLPQTCRTNIVEAFGERDVERREQVPPRAKTSPTTPSAAQPASATTLLQDVVDDQVFSSASRVRDGRGDRLLTDPPVTVHVHRINRLQRASRLIAVGTSSGRWARVSRYAEPDREDGHHPCGCDDAFHHVSLRCGTYRPSRGCSAIVQSTCFVIPGSWGPAAMGAIPPDGQRLWSRRSAA